MSKVLLIDTTGTVESSLQQALADAGLEVASVTDAQGAPFEGVDVAVLAAGSTDLGRELKAVMSARGEQRTPVVLATNLDRSGWDRTFDSEASLGVDGLLDLPINATALVARLQGIIEAQASVQTPAASDMASILARAITNEEAAAEFYRQAASRVTDPVVRDALEDLMHDEEEHKVLIEEFRDGKRSLPENVTSGGSLAETFGTPPFSTDLTPADAFLLAARKEKLAVEFYENWANLYPAGAERELLLKLAEIERRHKTRVEAMFTNAAFPEVW